MGIKESLNRIFLQTKDGKSYTHDITEYNDTNDKWDKVSIPMTDLNENLKIFANKIKEIKTNFEYQLYNRTQETEGYGILINAVHRHVDLAMSEVHIRAGDYTKDTLENLIKATNKEKNTQKIADLENMLIKLNSERKTNNIESIAIYRARIVFMNIIKNQIGPDGLRDKNKIEWHDLVRKFTKDLKKLEDMGYSKRTKEFENEVNNLINNIKKTYKEKTKENKIPIEIESRSINLSAKKKSAKKKDLIR